MQEPWKYEKLISLDNYMCLNKVLEIKFAEFEKKNNEIRDIYNYIFLKKVFCHFYAVYILKSQG